MQRLILCAAVAATGCVSRAGPYLTTLESVPGTNTLLIERCYWEWDRFTGRLGNADCVRGTLTLGGTNGNNR